MRWSGARSLRLLIVGLVPALLIPVDSRSATAAKCHGSLASYRIAGRLQLDRTPLNAGNGKYRVGPGKLTLRFENGEDAGPVQLLDFRLATNYSFTVSVIGMRTTVAVRAVSRATPDRSGVVAKGHFDGSVLEWSTPVRGYRSDGIVICGGALCGRFGLPPPGETRFSDGPAPMTFKPFRFRLADRRRFFMEASALPPMRRLHARGSLALVGRELQRRCASPRRSTSGLAFTAAR